MQNKKTFRALPLWQKIHYLFGDSALLLFVAALVALIWANSPWATTYFELWKTPVSMSLGPWSLEKDLLHWINDGLMAIFFFVVGLEIKREVLAGDLSSPRQALLPLSAAIGGMIVPALFYLFVNVGSEGVNGWGIPMATDIAFALGVLMVMGSHVPLSLKIFLTALAIVDDLGAVLVIAFFYTSEVSWFSLGVGALFMFMLLAANRMGIRHPLVYAVLGIGGLWMAFLLSGIHATIAGVLAALAIPARTSLNARDYLIRSRHHLEKFEKASEGKEVGFNTAGQQDALHDLEKCTEQAQPPLQRLEHSLHPWVSYFIMPLFALANAGVSLKGDLSASLQHPVALGIILGLVAGKPVGIFLFSWLAVKLKLAVLPDRVSWKQLLGVSCLGGIGFTMSLFIASLAFGESHLADNSKMGILLASGCSAFLGWLLLRKKQGG